jgi:FKBP-type peptidyl-prolyl cis-trans isomerase FkpA
VNVTLARRLIVAAAITAMATAAGGCIQAPASPTKTPAFARIDLEVGTGAEAVVGSVVTVNYTGWIYDPSKTDFKGGVFDTSLGREPFTFTLGAGTVITGWEQGLPGMKVGGTRRLILPPAYAYGGLRSGTIAAEASLVFDVQLVSIQ